MRDAFLVSFAAFWEGRERAEWLERRTFHVRPGQSPLLRSGSCNRFLELRLASDNQSRPALFDCVALAKEQMKAPDVVAEEAAEQIAWQPEAPAGQEPLVE